MMSNPPPSGPSRAPDGTDTPEAVTGRDVLPRIPSPSNPPASDSPAAPDGTSQSVLAPSAASGRLDHT